MRRPLTLSFVLALFMSVPVSAQRLWLTDDRMQVVGVEFTKGFIDHDPNFVPYYDGLSGIATFFGRVRIDPRMMLTAEIPLSEVQQSGVSFLDPKSHASTDRFGNPWIGVQGEFSPLVSLEVGVRPALVSQQSYVVPEFASIVDFDHFDAWTDDNTVVRGLIRAGRVEPRGVFTTGIVGATAAVKASNLYLDYGIRAGYAWPAVMASVAGTGRLLVSHNGVNSFDNRLFNQVEIGATLTRGTWQPKVVVRGYVDPGIRRTVKAIVTFGLVYGFDAKAATPSP